MKSHSEIVLGHADAAEDAAWLEEKARLGASDLVDALEGIGFSIGFETAQDGTVVMTFDWDRDGLARVATRNAGRRAKKAGLDSPLRQMTLAEAAAWLDGHGEQEGMAALGGVSRATYYRRRADLSKRASEHPGEPFFG